MTTGLARRRSIALRTVILLAAASALGNHAVHADLVYSQIFSRWFTSNPPQPPLGVKTVLYVTGNGAAAGNETNPTTGVTHGFVWTLTDGIVDPGTLGGPNAEIVGLNDNHLAAGNSTITAGGPTRAFAWSKADGLTDLGTLGGSFTEAAAISDNDWIVGRSALSGIQGERPFVWTRSGGMTTLPQEGCYPTQSGSKAGALAVTNNGLVAGYTRSLALDSHAEWVYHAALWDTTTHTCTDLFFSPSSIYFGNYSKAERVTNSGWVAGTISFAPSFVGTAGFVWSAASGVRTAGSRITDLNEDGWATAISGDHGLLLIPGEADIDIGSIDPGSPFFVLDNHIVVGTSFDELFNPHGFYWDQQTGRHELDAGATDHSIPLNHSGNRFVGVNYMYDEDTGEPGDVQLFVWDGTVHTLFSRSSFVTVDTTIQVGRTGFIAGAFNGGSVEATKMWAPPLSYNFSGLLPPTKNGAVNDVNAGQKVQFRFSLDGDRGPDVMRWGYPRIQDVNCDTWAGPVEDTTDGPGDNVNNLPPAPPLTLQPGPDRYSFIWDTDPSFANSCKTVTFWLVDGSGETAQVKFK